MSRKHLLQGIGSFLGMVLLILDAKTAFQGAQNGIELCIRTVIPSLFPFFVLSVHLTTSLSGNSIPVLQPIGNMLGIPAGAESILISGFLGGYPVGAQCITSMYRSNQLSKEDAQRMLSFCNNAGPAFLFGMVAPLFPSPAAAWLLWGIHILGALLAALVLPRPNHKQVCTQSFPASSPSAIKAAVNAMVNVCSWVILFRILITFLQRWFLWMLPAEVQPLLSGLLELSNGCIELSNLQDLRLRFLLTSFFLAFGGLCVTMQTASVTEGLSMHQYYLGKILQVLFSLFASFALTYGNYIPLGLFLLFLLPLGRKFRKKSSNPCFLGV